MTITITMTDEKADEATTAAAVAAAKALGETQNLALEVANPPAVTVAPDGVRVMCWLTIAREDL